MKPKTLNKDKLIKYVYKEPCRFEVTFKVENEAGVFYQSFEVISKTAVNAVSQAFNKLNNHRQDVKCLNVHKVEYLSTVKSYVNELNKHDLD